MVQAAQYFAFGFLEVYLPLQLADAGWKAWQIGPLFTLQILATTLTKPVLGRLADRVGRIKMIAGGLVLGAVALALIPYVSGYGLLAACCGLFGIGISGVTAATAALVADLAHDTSYGAAMGVLSSIMDVGQSAGPILGGLLVGAFGYRTAFLAVAALLVTTVVLFPSGVQPRPA
jgi:MFS family permease